MIRLFAITWPTILQSNDEDLLVCYIKSTNLLWVKIRLWTFLENLCRLNLLSTLLLILYIHNFTYKSLCIFNYCFSCFVGFHLLLIVFVFISFTIFLPFLMLHDFCFFSDHCICISTLFIHPNSIQQEEELPCLWETCTNFLSVRTLWHPATTLNAFLLRLRPC